VSPGVRPQQPVTASAENSHSEPAATATARRLTVFPLKYLINKRRLKCLYTYSLM
jgi:hypothetical protein